MTIQSHAAFAGAHHGHPATPTQLRLAREHRERQERLWPARKGNPPAQVLFQEPEPIAVAIDPPPPTDPYREQFAEAWRMLAESGSINTIDPIIRACCHYFKISKGDMISPRRTAAPVLARQIAMYLCRNLTIRSLPEIGRRFGGRDHTTVLHAVRKIERIKETDALVNRAVRELTSEVSSENEFGKAFSL